MSVTTMGETVTPARLTENWGSIEGLCVDLSGQIEQHSAETGEVFDMMIYVPRGGLFVVNIVARELGFDGTEIFAHVNSLYTGEVKGEAKEGQHLTRAQAEGKSAILVEEVIDTGETMEKTVEELEKLGLALLRVGTLHLKDHSIFMPDWSVVKTSGETWIDYPWEPHDKKGERSKVKRPTLKQINDVNSHSDK